MSTFVVIGGGMAAGHAVKQLRRGGFSGSVTVLTAESHLPYERPPLSKGVLQGTEAPESVFVNSDEWYRDNSVTVRTSTTATGIDSALHEVRLDTGERVPYDKLLIATGSRARTLPIAGHDLSGVHTLRTLDDSLELRARLAAGDKRVVFIGSGWIGMEVAASARMLGNSVTILERGRVPLAAALGEQLGSEFRRLHEEYGVVFHTEASVEAIVGAGTVEGVRIGGDAGGEVIPADIVVVGVGSMPNDEIAKTAGIAVDNGILVDEALRTGAADVFAAGDVANTWHPLLGQRIRSEHWANALNQGKAVARSMMGESVSYEELPYFYTDQYDFSMELSGYIPLMPDAEIVIRGDLAVRQYVAFWVRDERVVAGMNANVDGVNEAIQRLIQRGNIVGRERLMDASIEIDRVDAE